MNGSTIAVDYESVAKVLWNVFEPVHEGVIPFDAQWLPSFSARAHDLSGSPWLAPRLLQMLAAAEASGALDLTDGVSGLLGLHNFHVEHKIEIFESDGSGYVEDYSEDDAGDDTGFWTVYARNNEGLVFAIADTNAGQQAAEKLSADLEAWLALPD